MVAKKINEIVVNGATASDSNVSVYQGTIDIK
jgi:hypothetical protein